MGELRRISGHTRAPDLDEAVAETIAPTDLGEPCIDWESGEYARCS